LVDDEIAGDAHGINVLVLQIAEPAGWHISLFG
jgi:hypothetical protein